MLFGNSKVDHPVQNKLKLYFLFNLNNSAEKTSVINWFLAKFTHWKLNDCNRQITVDSWILYRVAMKSLLLNNVKNSYFMQLPV